MSPPRPLLSLIVPMYNESARIEAPLREMARYLGEQPYPSEIVLVDDGSTDESASVVAAASGALEVPLRLIRYAPNRGKGCALKVGFHVARGDRLVFSDCDLSTPIDELPRFLAALDGADVAIGTRRAVGAELLRRQPRLRESLGFVFTWIVRRSIAPVSDATCGFKAFTRDAGRDLFSRQRIHGWTFDAELLLNARRRGYRVTEVAVRWEDREGTKVHLVRDVLGSLAGIVRIRLLDGLGRYERAVPVVEYTEEVYAAAEQEARIASEDA